MVVAGQSGHELGAVYGKWTRAHVNRLRGKARPTGGNFMGIGIGYLQFILGGGGDSSREQQWRTTTIDGDKRRRVSWTVGQWEFRGSWLLTGILLSGVCFLLLKSGALGLDNIRNNFDLEFNEEDHSKQQITHGKMDEKVIWEN